MADPDDKRSRNTPVRYWLRYGVKTAAVILRIVLLWLDLGN